MRVISVLLSAFLLSFAMVGTALAYDFPSTNDQNRDQNLPHVNLISADIGSVTLEFTNGDAKQLSYFEVRVDGIATGTSPHPVVIGDTIHSGVCVDTRTNKSCPEGPLVITYDVQNMIEVRLALGGERDYDFDWTAFEALPDARVKDDCKDGGWAQYGFDNQGQCIRYVNTGQDSRP